MTTKRRTSKERTVVCQICGKEFSTTHSQAKYCPGECLTKSLRISRNRFSLLNRELCNERSRKRFNENKEARTAVINSYRKTETGKESVKRAGENQRLIHPEKYQARQEVLKALRKGLLVKEPCEVCGDIKVQAHHDDYSKPLAVRWLCIKHHQAIKIGEIKNVEVVK